MIGRVVYNLTMGKILLGQVLDISNPNAPIFYDFSNYPQFGPGNRVGFDLEVTSPHGVVIATNLRVPTEDDLALLPYAATGAMAPSPSGT